MTRARTAARWVRFTLQGSRVVSAPLLLAALLAVVAIAVACSAPFPYDKFQTHRDTEADAVSALRAPAGGAVVDARFTADGGHLLTIQDNGRATVWRLHTDQNRPPEAVMPMPRSDWLPGAVAADLQSRITCSAESTDDGRTRVTVARWHVFIGDSPIVELTAEATVTVPQPNARVDRALISPNGRFAVTSLTAGPPLVWALAENVVEYVVTLPAEVSGMPLLAFAPQGDWFVVAAGPAGIDGWAIVLPQGENATVVKQFRAGNDPGADPSMLAAAIAPDGSLLVTGELSSVGRGLPDVYGRMWRVTERSDGTRTALETQVFMGHGDSITCAAFTDDGTAVLTGSKDGVVELWTLDNETHRGTPILTLAGHETAIRGVFVSPNRELAITTAEDGSARLWLLP